mmetsp:Transcript_25904/g.49104  ORF Transcript_25904/g.49104 Transcript_25904/m.49104 type:complete len:379 (+) Transcript_25904:129-1265(+)
MAAPNPVPTSHLRRPPQGGVQKWLEIIARVLRLILWPLRQFTTLLFPGGELDGLSPAVAAKAAQSFKNYLRKVAPNGVSVEDAWSNLGFVAAKDEASNAGSLVLLYLHSPLHRLAESHCRKVLCHDALYAIITQPNVLALGLSIHSGQGLQLSQMLQIQAYPALCLLQPPPRGATSSNRSMTLLFRAEGNSLLAFSADQLSPILQSCVHRHHTILAEQEARRIEREQETLLRRQQDEEYQAALRADQERERQQAEAAAEEERLRREEEERIAEEERQAKAVVENAREKLRDPPSSGGAMIRFVLPTGQKLNRRFHGDDTIGSCKAFVRLHCHENEIEMGTIGLSTSFPKKSYNDDNDLTLEDAGLKPQAVLMVQDLDA